MPEYLVARGIEDRDLALEDRDERIAPITDAIDHIPDVRRALFAVLGKGRELRRGQRRTRWQWSRAHGLCHAISVASPTSPHLRQLLSGSAERGSRLVPRRDSELENTLRR